MRVQAVRAIATRQLLVLQRSPHRLFDVTVWPVVGAVINRGSPSDIVR